MKILILGANGFIGNALCKKLLADKRWREEIVDGCNIAVREGRFLFSDRVKEIEEVFNLQNSKNKSGQIEEFIPVKHKSAKYKTAVISIAEGKTESAKQDKRPRVRPVKQLLLCSLDLLLKLIPRK